MLLEIFVRNVSVLQSTDMPTALWGQQPRAGAAEFFRLIFTFLQPNFFKLCLFPIFHINDVVSRKVLTENFQKMQNVGTKH